MSSLADYYKRLRERLHNHKVQAFIARRRRRQKSDPNVPTMDFILVQVGDLSPKWSRDKTLRIATGTLAGVVRLRRYRARKMREYLRFQQKIDDLIAAEKDQVGSGAPPPEDFTEKEREEMEALITQIIEHNQELIDEMLGEEEPQQFDAFVINEDGTCYPPLNADMIGELLDRFENIDHDDEDAAWRHAHNYCELFLSHDKDDATPFLFRQDDNLQARFHGNMKAFMHQMRITHDHDGYDNRQEAIQAQLHAIVYHWQHEMDRPEHQMNTDNRYATNHDRWQCLVDRLPRDDPESSMSIGSTRH